MVCKQHASLFIMKYTISFPHPLPRLLSGNHLQFHLAISLQKVSVDPFLTLSPACVLACVCDN